MHDRVELSASHWRQRSSSVCPREQGIHHKSEDIPADSSACREHPARIPPTGRLSLLPQQRPTAATQQFVNSMSQPSVSTATAGNDVHQSACSVLLTGNPREGYLMPLRVGNQKLLTSRSVRGHQTLPCPGTAVLAAVPIHIPILRAQDRLISA